MLETMPMKFERKRTWGKHLTRNNKHYVQNEWDFWTIRRILMGQNVNENKAMTKVVIAINNYVGLWIRSIKTTYIHISHLSPPPSSFDSTRSRILSRHYSILLLYLNQQVKLCNPWRHESLIDWFGCIVPLYARAKKHTLINIDICIT